MNLTVLPTVSLYRRLVDLIVALSVRALLKKLPRVTPLIDDLQRSRGRLKKFSEARTDAEATAAEPTVETLDPALVVRRKSRGLQSMFDALELLLDDDNERARVQALRAALFDDTTTIKSEQRQAMASAALNLGVRMTPDIRSQLKAIAVGSSNLLAQCNAVHAAGRDLDAVLLERAAQQASATGTATGVSEEFAARHETIRVLNAVFQTLKLESIDDATRDALVAPFRREIEGVLAKRKSEKARANRKPRKADDKTPSGEQKKPAPVPAPANDNVSKPADGSHRERPAA